MVKIHLDSLKEVFLIFKNVSEMNPKIKVKIEDLLKMGMIVNYVLMNYLYLQNLNINLK